MPISETKLRCGRSAEIFCKRATLTVSQAVPCRREPVDPTPVIMCTGLGALPRLSWGRLLATQRAWGRGRVGGEGGV